MIKTDVDCMQEGELLSWIRDFLDSQSDGIKEYDDSLTRKLIRDIIIYEDKIEIVFKHGQMVEIEI